MSARRPVISVPADRRPLGPHDQPYHLVGEKYLTAVLDASGAIYGEKILSAPTTEGFNLLAWLMPFGAIVAGCGLLFGVASRWRAANAR